MKTRNDYEEYLNELEAPEDDKKSNGAGFLIMLIMGPG
jgi:hypothetical protein